MLSLSKAFTHRCAIGVSASVAALTGALAVTTADAMSTKSVAALIERKTQEFSDAGLTGDRAVMERDLASDVAFTNEDGSTPSKQEIIQGAAPSKTTNPRLKVTEFKVRVSGPIAVATFVDVLTYVAYGQPQLYRFRSTEVWRKEMSGWRMIASQSLALAEDPPAVALSADLLDEYAGDYQAGPDTRVRIARVADGITSTATGAAPITFKPELKDVFFLPGRPHLRRIFQRDAQGRVTGYINRLDGHDIWVRRM